MRLRSASRAGVAARPARPRSRPQPPRTRAPARPRPRTRSRPSSEGGRRRQAFPGCLAPARHAQCLGHAQGGGTLHFVVGRLCLPFAGRLMLCNDTATFDLFTSTRSLPQCFHGLVAGKCFHSASSSRDSDSCRVRPTTSSSQILKVLQIVCYMHFRLATRQPAPRHTPDRQSHSAMPNFSGCCASCSAASARRQKHSQPADPYQEAGVVPLFWSRPAAVQRWATFQPQRADALRPQSGFKTRMQAWRATCRSAGAGSSPTHA